MGEQAASVEISLVQLKIWNVDYHGLCTDPHRAQKPRDPAQTFVTLRHLDTPFSGHGPQSISDRDIQVPHIQTL